MLADPSAIRALAALLSARADEVRAEGDRLIGRSVATAWIGRAGDAMRTAVADIVNEMRVAAELHDNAATALLHHADAVETTFRLAAEAAAKADDLAHDAGHLLHDLWRAAA